MERKVDEVFKYKDVLLKVVKAKFLKYLLNYFDSYILEINISSQLVKDIDIF